MKARHIGLGALVLVFGAALGCGGYSWQADLRRHAAVQHGCPEDQIEILSDDGNALSRRARVDVCGTARLYHHFNNGATYVWRDDTGGSEDAAPYIKSPDELLE